jgi:K+-transporting ATPase ATPase C chain
MKTSFAGMIISALRASLVALALCGLVYPLMLTTVGQVFLPFQASGSLVRSQDGAVIGSRPIGQQWIGPEWFHGRPSATTGVDPSDSARTVPAPYNAASSSGSNLGPTSKNLADRLARDRKALEAAQLELAGKPLPADMLTASASGLDPDISPANAHLQASRVARARGVPVAQIDELIQRHVIGRSLGVFGESRVNVLELNLALAAAPGQQAL